MAIFFCPCSFLLHICKRILLKRPGCLHKNSSSHMSWFFSSVAFFRPSSCSLFHPLPISCHFNSDRGRLRLSWRSRVAQTHSQWVHTEKFKSLSWLSVCIFTEQDFCHCLFTSQSRLSRNLWGNQFDKGPRTATDKNRLSQIVLSRFCEKSSNFSARIAIVNKAISISRLSQRVPSRFRERCSKFSAFCGHMAAVCILYLFYSSLTSYKFRNTWCQMASL